MMTLQPNLELKPTAEAEGTYRRWITHVYEELTRHTSVDRRSEFVRDELFQIYLGHPHGNKPHATLTTELASSVLFESFDPRNVTLASEYDTNIDREQYAIRKPLIYFWQMFDRSPLGVNQWLGFKLRCMLGKLIFRHLGKGVRIFHNVEFTFGYNITVEDNCIIHPNVRLDDHGEIILREDTCIADYSIINSDQSDAASAITELGPRARIAPYSNIPAGAHIGEK